MKFKLNCSPHLRMHEITKQLFNNKFLSDIRFAVDDKIIYAHSLELMKRSLVFEDQLKATCGKKQIISITNCKYECFLEFIRFLYTDECDINVGNGIELLKLANKYQVVILENRIINKLATIDWLVQLYEYCADDKYEIVQKQIEDLVTVNFGECLKTKQFLTLKPDVVKKLLQFDCVEQGVAEIQILNALTCWIENYCKQHEMPLEQGRKRFDDLISQIRFPIMSNAEIGQCIVKYPGLLNEIIDPKFTGIQFLFGKYRFEPKWISTPRKEWEYRLESRIINRNEILKTTFSVSKVTILNAIWVGIEENRNEIQIILKKSDNKKQTSSEMKFIQSAPEFWQPMLISLGDSIRLRPNHQYTITINYLGITDRNLNVVCRIENANLIFNDPQDCIKILGASDNMLEMVFKVPAD